MTERLTGSCFCGAVEIAAEGAPFAMGYCHCADCRAWSAQPLSSFTLWPPEAVSVTRGAEHVISFSRTGSSHRKSCGKCGGHLMTEVPEAGFTDVYAAILPGLDFRPECHVHYREAVMAVADGLPKFRDLPEEAGGSGEMAPE